LRIVALGWARVFGLGTYVLRGPARRAVGTLVWTDLVVAVAVELVSCCDLLDVCYDTCSRGLVGRSFPCDRASTHPFVDGPRTAKARPRSGLKFARHRLNQFDRPALLPAAHNQAGAWSLPARSRCIIELAGSRRGSHTARRRTDTVTKVVGLSPLVVGSELHFCCLRRRTGATVGTDSERRAQGLEEEGGRARRVRPRSLRRQPLLFEPSCVKSCRGFGGRPPSQLGLQSSTTPPGHTPCRAR
jgi:hypothetical protein